jgi:hypothetical protein
MGTEFWAGIFLGAVVGFSGDVLGRPFHRLLDRRLEARSTARASRLEEELHRDRAALRDFLVLQVLETTLVGALVAILAGVLFAAGSFLRDSDLNRVLIVGGQIVSMVGAFVIVRIAGDAITVARSLRRFEAPVTQT